MMNWRLLSVFCLIAAVLGVASPAQADMILRPRGDGQFWQYGAIRPELLPGASAFSEGQLRLGTQIEIEPRFYGEVRGAFALTAFDDLSGYAQRFGGRLDRAFFAVEAGRFNLMLGRQALDFGSGFLVADGVNDLGLAALGEGEAPFSIGGARFSNPYDDFDALRLLFRGQRLAAEAFVANLSPTLRYAEEGATALTYSDGWLSGADIYGRFPWARFGLSEVLRLRDESLQFNTALRGEIMPDAPLSGDFELVVQSEKGGNAPRLAQAFYGQITQRWPYHALAPEVGAGFYYFSGDHPQTEVNEAFEPLFAQAQPLSPFVLGEIMGRRHLRQSDLMVARISSSLALNGDQELGTRLYAHFTHRGTDICMQEAGSPYCVLQPEDRLGTAGVKDLLTTEMDFYFLWRRHRPHISVEYTAILAFVQPFEAASAPLYQDPANGPVLGASAAVQGMIGARAIY